jgi:hypothetical protein
MQEELFDAAPPHKGNGQSEKKTPLKIKKTESMEQSMEYAPGTNSTVTPMSSKHPSLSTIMMSRVENF